MRTRSRAKPYRSRPAHGWRYVPARVAMIPGGSSRESDNPPEVVGWHLEIVEKELVQRPGITDWHADALAMLDDDDAAG